MNLKNKIILLLSALILIVVSTVTTYNLLHEKQENIRRLGDAHEHVYRTYSETIKDTIHFYNSRSAANLASPGIMEAFKKRDHDTLYALMKPRWIVMQRENPWLSVLQFHQADGRSLLRMHQPELYGDNIAQERPMVAYAHANMQSVSGFEEGRQGLAFRILIPIFSDGDYIGLVEFGIATPYFTDRIRRFVGYESFFFVKQEILGHFGKFQKSLVIGQNIGLDIPSKYQMLLYEYGHDTQELENDVVTFMHQAYEINVIKIDSYKGDRIGSIMFIRPTEDFGSHVRHSIIAAGLITFFLILIIALVTDRIYTYIVRKMSFQERYSQTILDSVPSPVIVTNGEELIAANESFLGYFHFGSLDEFKKEHKCVCEYFEEGGTDEYLMPMRDDKRWTEHMLDHPMKTHKAKITIDGSTNIFEVRISALKVNDNIRYVVIFNDISSMQIQSIRDALTGIANRLHFSMVYQHAFNVAKRSKKPLSIIFFDIDHFKLVNDTYGHLAGDMVLKQLASLISLRIRNSDIFARWGGEEFILLLPDTTLEEAIGVAKVLKDAIGAEAFETVGKVTCSFGVAVLHEDESHENLLKRSDEKLYEAKEAGRDRIVY